MTEKLKLIIDTGTWLKLDKLYRDKAINNDFIDGLFSLAEICITHEIEFELNHFLPLSWKKEKTHVIPVRNKEAFSRALKDGFDPADSSIFGIENITDYYILSEDRPLLAYGRMYKLNFVFFVEFLARLLESDIINKTELYSLNQELYNLKNIDKRLFTKIKKFAQEH